MALQNHSFDVQYFLDLETGEIIFCPDDLGMLPDDDKAHMVIEDTSDRFLVIRALESRRGYEIMAEFVETQVSNCTAMRQLQSALSGKSPFRRFKDVLAGYPAIRAEWFDYEKQAYLAEAANWLQDEGITANWVKAGAA